MYHNFVIFTRIWGFYLEGVWPWRISGVSHRRWCEWPWDEY